MDWQFQECDPAAAGTCEQARLLNRHALTEMEAPSILMLPEQVEVSVITLNLPETHNGEDR